MARTKSELRKTIEKAERLFDSDKLHAALSTIEDGLDNNTSRGVTDLHDAYNLAGEICMAMDNFDEAKRYLMAAIDLNRPDGKRSVSLNRLFEFANDAHFLGDYYYSLQEFDLCLEIADDAIATLEANGADESFVYVMTDLLMMRGFTTLDYKKGSLETARECMKKAMNAFDKANQAGYDIDDSRMRLCLLGLMSVALQSNDFEAVIACFNEAIALKNGFNNPRMSILCGLAERAYTELGLKKCAHYAALKQVECAIAFHETSGLEDDDSDSLDEPTRKAITGLLDEDRDTSKLN